MSVRNKSWGRLRLLLVLAVACVLVFDTVGILVNRVTADEAARVAARHAAEALVTGSVPPALWSATATAAANASLADQGGVELVDLQVADGRATLSVRRGARVLLAGRIRALRDQVTPVVTASAPVQ
jgi:hypothetical protein